MPSPPCAIQGPVRLGEQVEDAGQYFGGDADARIPHTQHRLLASRWTVSQT